MRLHWSPKSPYVRKVMVCAHELGLVDRIDRVRTVAAMARPNHALMRDNPLSKIPALVLADGSALFDSPVICEYLDALAGGTLFPRQGDERWRALRWQALGDGLLDALILWRNERERESPLAPLMAAFEVKAAAVLHRLEAEVPALEGARLCIGAISIGCALGYLDHRFAAWAWRDRAPGLARWFARLGSRPGFVKTAPVEG
jgi:glutathione S-transferase